MDITRIVALDGKKQVLVHNVLVSMHIGEVIFGSVYLLTVWNGGRESTIQYIHLKTAPVDRTSVSAWLYKHYGLHAKKISQAQQ